MCNNKKQKQIVSKKKLLLKKRILIETLSKTVTWFVVCTLIGLGEVFHIQGWVTAIVSTTFWFICPDIMAFILEILYEVEHKHDCYR